jgi:hypothetical protein
MAGAFRLVIFKSASIHLFIPALLPRVAIIIDLSWMSTSRRSLALSWCEPEVRIKRSYGYVEVSFVKKKLSLT